jgi:hypothetical protein
MQHDSLIVKKEDFDIETRFGTLEWAMPQTTNNRVHIIWQENLEYWSRISRYPTRHVNQ